MKLIYTVQTGSTDDPDHNGLARLIAADECTGTERLEQLVVTDKGIGLRFGRNEWTDWDGSDVYPAGIDGETLVQIRMRGGYFSEGEKAHNWVWSWTQANVNANIVQYKVVTT